MKIQIFYEGSDDFGIQSIELVAQIGDNSKRKKHTALIDCELLTKVYINLIDQKEPTLDLKTDDYKSKNSSFSKIEYYKQVIKPTTKELEQHSQYLKVSLKKNFF